MRVIVTVINDIATDQRVLKQVGVLKDAGLEVTVIGRMTKKSPDLPENLSGSVRHRLLFSHGPLMYAAFNIRLLFSLLFRKAEICLANDLDTLLPCYLTSKLFRRTLVYDAHEYFTEQYGLRERKFTYSVWKYIEKKLLPGIKWMITVNDAIALLYKKEYGVNPVVVRNVSYSSTNVQARNKSGLGLSESDFLAVIHGTGLNPGRGVDELVRAIEMTEGISLLIIGTGDNIDRIKANVTSSHLNDRIIFLPRMPWESMIGYIKCCDTGLSLDADVSVNQRHSLPNKLFDYISAGIPVLASRLPEIESVINQYGCGLLIEDVDPVSISTALKKLRDDKKLLLLLKEKSQQASEILTWEKEKEREQEFISLVIKMTKEK